MLGESSRALDAASSKAKTPAQPWIKVSCISLANRFRSGDRSRIAV